MKLLYIVPITSLFAVTACQPTQKQHVEIYKQGGTFNDALMALRACRLEGEEAAGSPPVGGPIMSLAGWSAHRDQIITLCLENKGYVAVKQPGACIMNCVGSVSIRLDTP